MHPSSRGAVTFRSSFTGTSVTVLDTEPVTFPGRMEVQPGVFMPPGGTSYFHVPTMTEDDHQAWLADDVNFADSYEGWTSGDGSPYRENSSPTLDEIYSRAVLRSYLPGFAAAEELADPYRENTSPTPGRKREGRSYSLSDRRAAILMAERLGVRKTSVKLGIPRSTLRSWIKAEESYRENTSPTSVPGRKRGSRPERVCACGTPTRYHVNYKPTCQSCYVSSEDYQSDRRQWRSDMVVLTRVMGGTTAGSAEDAAA